MQVNVKGFWHIIFNTFRIHGQTYHDSESNCKILRKAISEKRLHEFTGFLHVEKLHGSC